MENDAGTQTSSPSTSPAPVEISNTLHQASHTGTVIPNRIFVGGIGGKAKENDLRCFFSEYGVIREVNIVTDRDGISKGYGFVTFETQEDAQKILHDADRLSFRDKRINVGQAFRKQLKGHYSYTADTQGSSMAYQAPFGTTYLTTPTGYPYTYHNGVAYFHTPEPNTLSPSHWHAPPHTMSGSSVMVTHSASSICIPQPYHNSQASSQYVPGHVPWTIPQVEASSQYVSGHVPWTIPQVETSVPVNPSSLSCIQPAEVMYQPMEMPAENWCFQSAMPLMEATIPEEQRFHPVRRSFSRSAAHLKPRYHHGHRYTHLHKNYRPDVYQAFPASPAPASSPGLEMPI
ncbi:protein boule-like isoform X1 [Astyanax mexicanus]|uniref:Protein boule-like n=1 Tax=Astyanax mexicanus TaxID=7994 RepID=A0A8T2LYZ6_ASTMX|nr:protein boule-like isoform X1 [Astyanax mexicanus]KAG9277548.1 protein boule-like isoform X1 [Astyanax mexicanus]